MKLLTLTANQLALYFNTGTIVVLSSVSTVFSRSFHSIDDSLFHVYKESAA